MAPSLLCIVVFLHHIIISISEYEIDCYTSGWKCYYYTINCPDDDDCLVNCAANNGCNGATINCPTNGYCKVLCDNSNACYSATINAVANQQLNVSCTTEDSCQITNIHGATDSELNILCTNNDACRYASFLAFNSSWLRLLDCATGYGTCTGITVQCPQNINGQKRCIIQGIYRYPIVSEKHIEKH